MTAAIEGGEWSASRPGHTLPPGKTRYPLYRRLGGNLIEVNKQKQDTSLRIHAHKYCCLHRKWTYDIACSFRVTGSWISNVLAVSVRYGRKGAGRVPWVQWVAYEVDHRGILLWLPARERDIFPSPRHQYAIANRKFVAAADNWI